MDPTTINQIALIRQTEILQEAENYRRFESLGTGRSLWQLARAYLSERLARASVSETEQEATCCDTLAVSR